MRRAPSSWSTVDRRAAGTSPVERRATVRRTLRHMSPRTDATTADAVLEHIGVGADLIVPLANGEPVTVLDAIEAAADGLDGVRVHQMHALRDRRYLHGEFGDRMHHVSYFLSEITRPCFRAGTIDLVPNNLSEMRAILSARTSD